MKTNNTAKTTSSIKHLSLLQPGSVVSMDVLTTSGKKARCRTMFIGYLPNHYLLLQFPDPVRFADVAPLLEPGVGVTVRGLVERNEGAIVAFRTVVKQQVTLPSRLLVMAFPVQSQLQNLRSAMRIATHIPLTLVINDKRASAVMTDLSNQGCRVTLATQEPLVVLNGESVTMYLGKGDTDHPGQLTATICNNRLGKNSYNLGLQFAKQSIAPATELLHQSIIGESASTA